MRNRQVRKLFLTLGIVVAVASAQSATQVFTDQLKARSTTKGYLLGVLPGTGMIHVQLGTNLTFATAADGSTVLNGATTTPNVQVIGEMSIPTAAQSAFTLANANVVPGSIQVYKNGVRQSLTNDYTVVGNVVTFLAATAAVPGDSIQFDYAHQ